MQLKLMLFALVVWSSSCALTKQNTAKKNTQIFLTSEDLLCEGGGFIASLGKKISYDLGIKPTVRVKLFESGRLIGDGYSKVGDFSKLQSTGTNDEILVSHFMENIDQKAEIKSVHLNFSGKYVVLNCKT